MAPLMNFSKFHFITSLSIKFSQKFVPFINPKSFTLSRMILRDKAAYFNGPPSCEKVNRLPVALLSRILCVRFLWFLFLCAHIIVRAGIFVKQFSVNLSNKYLLADILSIKMKLRYLLPFPGPFTRLYFFPFLKSFFPVFRFYSFYGHRFITICRYDISISDDI